MAKKSETKTVSADPVAEVIIAAAETQVAAENAAKSNFAGSIEEAFDEAEKEGEKDGTGKAALLATGIIAAKHGKVLRGTGKDADKEFQANIMALRLRYVEGFNRIAAKTSPLDMIAIDPDEKSKAYKANKKQANKLGVFVKAGCHFATPEETEAYINRVLVAISKTDYSNAKNRESTFERVKSVLTKVDALAKDKSDETLLEECKPTLKEEATTTETSTTETVAEEATLPKASHVLQNIAAELSQFVAKYPVQMDDAKKLNAMVAELSAMAKMHHAADTAEDMAAAKAETKAA